METINYCLQSNNELQIWLFVNVQTIFFGTDYVIKKIIIKKFLAKILQFFTFQSFFYNIMTKIKMSINISHINQINEIPQ